MAENVAVVQASIQRGQAPEEQDWRRSLRPVLRPSRPLPPDWREAAFWKRPVWLVVLMLVLLCYPNSSTTDTVSLARPTPADAGAVLLILVVGFRVFSDEIMVRLRTGYLLPLIAVTAAAAISTLFSHDPVLSAAGFARVLELFVLVPAATFLAVRDRRDLVTVLGAVVGIAVFQGLVGLYQTVSGSGASFGSSDVRAVGTFGIGDQLAMATLVGCGLVLCVGAALTLPGRRRLVAAGGAAFLALPLAVSLSRGSVLAAGVATLAVAVVTGWRKLFALLITVAIVAIVVFGVVGAGGSVVGQRLVTIGSSGTAPDRSVQDRYDLWQAAERMWQLHPVTGVGVKNFVHFRDGEAPLDLSSGSDAASGGRFVRVQLLSPHNEYLLILSEQGLLGLAALLSYLFVLIVGPLRRLRGSVTPVDACIAVGFFGLGVRALVDFTYGDVAGSSALLLAVLFGLGIRCAQGNRGDAAPPAHS
jgi:O-antigen ligase